ncbi:sensor histidine kinase [Leifsonia xyli]|uniref:hypothetical protein n=1 Tax=Leifsonia xyli TaxID=1575 RepID=UPI0003F65F79|nr:hypothetical protein [Leifsonia xyli]
MRRRAWSVAGRVFGVQVIALLVTGSVLTVVVVLDAQNAVTEDAAQKSLAVSQTIASDPSVRDALLAHDPTAALQPYALAVIGSASVDFVTIMSPKGIRFTHPHPNQIGRRFLGTISEAQAGRTITETYTGTLGPSVRAVVPILRDGQLVGIVSAGVRTASLGSEVLPRVPFLIGVLAVVALPGAAAAVTRRSLSRMIGRMLPEQMARMVQFSLCSTLFAREWSSPMGGAESSSTTTKRRTSWVFLPHRRTPRPVPRRSWASMRMSPSCWTPAVAWSKRPTSPRGACCSSTRSPRRPWAG